MDKRNDNAYLPLNDTVTPATAIDVLDVVRRAAYAGTPVYPIGGATRLFVGARPAKPGLGLSTAKMNRVVDHAARDLTITVEPGITVAKLQKKLAAKRQRLPVEIPFADRATIGGAVALADAGPGRYRWGTIRDYVLGFRAVDGNGTEFSGGGRVVKNAAGYNLCRLMTGSFGTLGVLTQVTLMVRPMPEAVGLLDCGVNDFGMAERLLAGLVRTETLPTAIEWSLLRLQDANAGSAGRLAVSFEGTRAEVDWMLETLAAELKEAGAESLAVTDKRQVEAFQRISTEFAAVDTRFLDKATVRISVLPSVLVKTVEQIMGFAPETAIQAHAGDGILFAQIPVDAEAAPAMIRERLRPLVEEVGGTMVVTSLPDGSAADPQLIWGPRPAGFDVMRAIKGRLDPNHLLNPGRFIFD